MLVCGVTILSVMKATAHRLVTWSAQEGCVTLSSFLFDSLVCKIQPGSSMLAKHTICAGSAREEVLKDVVMLIQRKTKNEGVHVVEPYTIYTFFQQ